MAVRVVCISRTDGALGEQIGDLVARRLDFRYVDDQVIVRAARLAQVDPSLVAAVEQRQPLLRRLIANLGAARDLVGPAALGLHVPAARDDDAYRGRPEDLRLLIGAAIHEIAADGDVVIAAHAASMTLAIRPDVFRVLVTASNETRARRVAEAQGLTPEAAAAAIATGDRNRDHYFRHFHSVDRELPTHYDLVVNTDTLWANRAADVIAYAARAAQ
jgi:hypothetical protein